jgi:hypothetical protein
MGDNNTRIKTNGIIKVKKTRGSEKIRKAFLQSVVINKTSLIQSEVISKTRNAVNRKYKIAVGMASNTSRRRLSRAIFDIASR